MKQNDPKILLQKVKQNQAEGSSVPSVSVTEDLLFQLHVNNMLCDWLLRNNGVSECNLFIKSKDNLK